MNLVKTKKILSLLVLSVLMAIVCVGCAPKTVEEAYEKADKMVAKWSDSSEYLCSYYSDFLEEKGVPIYLVKAQSLSVEDETDSFKCYNALTVSNFVYEELSPIFENFSEVVVSIAILDENNETYYLTSNGEVIFNLYE